MKKIKVLVFIIIFPYFAYSQQWHQYSDSIRKITSVKYNQSDLDRALKFVELADNDFKKINVKKDTIYADYLYRKGTTLYFSKQLFPELFEESLTIWEQSLEKNYFKIMKIHYFLAEVYNVKNDYKKAYINYEYCYLINKKYRLPKNTYFTSSIYCLSVIDYKENLNYRKAEQYANEYIEHNKENAYLNYDFNYAYAFRWKEDPEGYENVLLEFRKNYENGKLNNPQLFFQINFELFTYYYKIKNIKEIDRKSVV